MSIGLTSASEGGLDGVLIVELGGRDTDCEVSEASDDGREEVILGGHEVGCEVIEASDIDLEENARLGGRDADCEAEDERLLEEGVSIAGTGGVCLVLGSNGHINDTLVRALLNTGFSSRSSGGGAFFSGALYSNFPFLSEAKYSSPRPNTTWRVAKSRSEPSDGHSHCSSAGGRS